MAAALLSLLLCTSSPVAADTVLICPPQYLTALEPWLEHRMRQGHRFTLVSNLGSPAEIREGIRRAAAESGKLQYVVIVGDDDPAAIEDQRLRASCTPSYRRSAEVNIHWGSEPEIATDNWYADLDDDHLPDLAMGRLTADSPQELTRMVRKILTYENANQHGSWRRQINLVAGVGDFGPLLDSMLEGLTKRFLIEGIPASYATHVTYASWRSPYCPDPRDFRSVTRSRLGEGCLLWVYVGHGQPQSLDHVRVPTGTYPILSKEDVVDLAPTAAAPIALMLACYTAAFDAAEDCLAEEMLRAEGGPVAVLGGSRVTMPYAMSVMSQEMMRQLFQEQPETLGQVFLQAKRAMVEPQDVGSKSATRLMLDTVARLFTPSADLLTAELHEHLALFNLLGDPLLRLHYPQAIDLQLPKRAEAGQDLEVSGTLPLTGRCTIELVCQRDRATTALPTRERFEEGSQFLADFNATYAKANEHRYYTGTFLAQKGPFRTKLPVPAEAAGPCHVRIYLEADDSYALGAADVTVVAPAPVQER